MSNFPAGKTLPWGRLQALAYIMALFSTSKTLSSTPPYTHPLISLEPLFPVLTPGIPRTRSCHVAHFATRKAPSPFMSSLQPVHLSLVRHLFNNPCLWNLPPPNSHLLQNSLPSQLPFLLSLGPCPKPPGKSSYSPSPLRKNSTEYNSTPALSKEGNALTAIHLTRSANSSIDSPFF